MIFGLLGYAGSGKDEVAKILIEKGWKRLAFGDKVKECLYALNPNISGPNGPMPLQEAVDCLGWDTVKQWPEVRGLLQRLGTEMGRRCINEHLWINLLIPELLTHRSQSNLVVTDIRFPNEASLLDKANGKLIRVVRPGVDPPNDHSSERDAEKIRPDHTLNNDGDLNDLAAKVDELIDQYQELLI